MRGTTYNFLISIGIPDTFDGFEVLGDAVEIYMDNAIQNSKTDFIDVCVQLGEKYAVSPMWIDMAMRRVIGGAIRHSYTFPNPIMVEVLGNSCRQITSPRSFLFKCSAWLLNHEKTSSQTRKFQCPLWRQLVS